MRKSENTFVDLLRRTNAACLSAVCVDREKKRVRSVVKHACFWIVKSAASIFVLMMSFAGGIEKYEKKTSKVR